MKIGKFVFTKRKNTCGRVLVYQYINRMTNELPIVIIILFFIIFFTLILY